MRNAKDLLINATAEGVAAAKLINSEKVTPMEVMGALDVVFKSGAVGSRYHLNSLDAECSGRFRLDESEFYLSTTKIYAAGGQFIWSATEEGGQFWGDIFEVVDILSGKLTR